MTRYRSFTRLVVFSLLIRVLTVNAIAQNPSFPEKITPRMRVIVDNDFSGDPDGLFQLAHLLLSPAADTRAIIGSHLGVNDFLDSSHQQAANAVKKANELIAVMGISNPPPVIRGSETAMPDDQTPVKSEGVDFIIKEALRTDTKLPLYVVCGAGLTEIASALIKDRCISLSTYQPVNFSTLLYLNLPDARNASNNRGSFRLSSC